MIYLSRLNLHNYTLIRQKLTCISTSAQVFHASLKTILIQVSFSAYISSTSFSSSKLSRNPNTIHRSRLTLCSPGLPGLDLEAALAWPLYLTNLCSYTTAAFRVGLFLTKLHLSFSRQRTKLQCRSEQLIPAT